jgi:Peptidase family M48
MLFMSFLDWPIEVDKGPCKSDPWRKRVAEELIDRFSQAFPQITYTLLWDSQLINAQAWRLGEQRNVYLYGGLVRHPAIARAGLALTLAHETGHHLGGEPYDPVMTWMTNEKQSDHWAAVSCMPSLFGSRASSLTLRGAHEIAKLQHAFKRAQERAL